MIRIGFHLYRPKMIKKVYIIDTKEKTIPGCILKPTWSLNINETRPSGHLSTPGNIIYEDVTVCQQYNSRFKRNLWLVKLFWKLLVKKMFVSGFVFPTFKYCKY